MPEEMVGVTEPFVVTTDAAELGLDDVDWFSLRDMREDMEEVSWVPLLDAPVAPVNISLTGGNEANSEWEVEPLTAPLDTGRWNGSEVVDSMRRGKAAAAAAAAADPLDAPANAECELINACAATAAALLL